MQSVNVICMKWGSLYNAEYVNKLYNSVKRNLTLDFNFYCFTEDGKDINQNINHITKSHFHKSHFTCK